MCFGPMSRLCHWGPLTALSIIKVVSGVTIYCNSILFPTDTIVGFLNYIGFMSISGLSLFNFLSAIFHGPGYLPLQWQPKKLEDTQYLQECAVCRGYKAPRSHHCRKCGRCVMKMDHHCPWINNCVGWGNQAHFTAFLAFSVLGCMYSTGVLSTAMYRSIYSAWYRYYSPKTIIQFTVYGLILCVFALGLAIGVIIAVGMLLFFQVRAIIRNRTGIEDWILEKALRRKRADNTEFHYPYNLGFMRNTEQVINWRCVPVGDGIDWEVAEGCDQYTLTREQIEQKADKKRRIKLYHIVKPASGAWFPITQGLAVCLCIPCSDETRMKLDVGDKILVSRWYKYWLFGEKLQENLSDEEKASKRMKGWFPRKCAALLDEAGTSKKVK